MIEEAVGGGDAFLGALAVEGPVENPPGTAPVVGGHAVEPVAHQGGLAHSSECDEGEDMRFGVLPGGVEAGELGLPADQEGAGDGEAAEVEAGESPLWGRRHKAWGFNPRGGTTPHFHVPKGRRQVPRPPGVATPGRCLRPFGAGGGWWGATWG